MGVTKPVVTPLQRLEMMLMKSSGSPRLVIVRTIWSWSTEGKAPLEYM
jgi:hypothetical protein